MPSSRLLSSTSTCFSCSLCVVSASFSYSIFSNSSFLLTKFIVLWGTLSHFYPSFFCLHFTVLVCCIFMPSSRLLSSTSTCFSCSLCVVSASFSYSIFSNSSLPLVFNWAVHRVGKIDDICCIVLIFVFVLRTDCLEELHACLLLWGFVCKSHFLNQGFQTGLRG